MGRFTRKIHRQPKCVATMGAANLAACVICRGETEFYEFLTGKAATLPGVQRVETAPVIRTVKQASPTGSPIGAGTRDD